VNWPAFVDITVRMRTSILSVIAVVVTGIVLSAQESASYRIGAKDVIEVSVWGHEELSGKFVVAPEGTISYPMLGSVKVADLTSTDVERAVTAGLADGYLKKPQVSVRVAEYLSRRLFVMGEVRTPGPIPITGAITVLEALSRAGSMTEQAGGEVVVLRPGRAAGGPAIPGQDHVTELGRLKVQQLRAGTMTANLDLGDGDTIFVPRAESIFVLGMVNAPGSYTIEPGSTTVLRAIALAGGVSQLGSTGRVRITRIVDGKKVELKAKLDELLKPGDTVVVGTRLF
jgi:polysaccharide biosynthesis/export protein